jgi:hypothetical protein
MLLLQTYNVRSNTNALHDFKHGGIINTSMLQVKAFTRRYVPLLKYLTIYRIVATCKLLRTFDSLSKYPLGKSADIEFVQRGKYVWIGPRMKYQTAVPGSCGFIL